MSRMSFYADRAALDPALQYTPVQGAVELLGAASLVSEGNKLQVTFNINFAVSHAISFGTASAPYTKITKYSLKHFINKLCFETRVVLNKEVLLQGGLGTQHQNQLFVRFTKEDNDDSIYSIHLVSKNLKINKKFLCDETEWRLVCENNQLDYTFDATVQVRTLDNKFPPRDRGLLANFATLHDDTALTDFELRGVDGSVHIHCAILAAFSPAFRRMLEGKWKETENRILVIQETSQETLQHLKDYLYLDILPDSGLEPLLLLATCYLMEDLRVKCMDKIINNFNAQNAIEISKFALSHNIMELYFAFLDHIRNESIKVEDIRDHNN